MFWVRLRSDGCYEGPIHDSAIEDVRKRSGAWIPLYTAAPALTEDTRILDWLELRHVTVREPMRWGSREVFTSHADFDLEEPTKPSDLRERVRGTLRSTQGEK